jgi:SPX domain protein involved in polyphosphate accumulation
MENGYRHEFKYLISKRSADILRYRLPHVMQRDPNTGETGKYTIRSLYFDDLSNSALDEKLSGLAHREKFRIRYYNYDPTFLKLELKEKHGNLTKKTAASITFKEAEIICSASANGIIENPNDLVHKLQQDCRLCGLRPRVLVDYDRTPFVCKDGNTRITLDENLRTRPYCTDLLAPEHAMIPILDRDQVILEVKFDDFLPGYLDAAMADIPKAALAISKFALCLSHN